MPPPRDWAPVVLKHDCPRESDPDPGAHPRRADCMGRGGAANLHLQPFRKRFFCSWPGNQRLQTAAACDLRSPPEHCAWRWAQSLHSVNTCWAAACNDTKMKYKGEIKYIKAFIRRTAWFSLSLAWFLLCPGHVGSVLIFMASAPLMYHHFISSAVLPVDPFLLWLLLDWTRPPGLMREGGPRRRPSSSGSFHAVSPPCWRKAEAVLVASFS